MNTAHFLCRSLVFLFLAALSAAPVHAVVVAGANGGGNTTNNTTQEQLEDLLGTDADYFQNVVAYSDAGAVYLGYANTVDGPKAYALSASHITFASTMIIQGLTYNVSRTKISNSDVSLLTLTRIDGLMPTLPKITIASDTPTAGTGVVMIGYGKNRVQNATTNASVSDAVTISGSLSGYTTGTNARIKRWGTNSTVLISGSTTYTTAFSGTTTFAATVFTQPASNGWLSSNEAQAVLGDSGGGVFTADGVLLGLMSTISGTNANEAYFGEATFFSNLPTYKTAIEQAIGYNVIPEPSALALCAVGLAGGILLWLRRQPPTAVATISSDIVRLENAGHDDDALRAGHEHFIKVFPLDASDAKDRKRRDEPMRFRDLR